MEIKTNMAENEFNLQESLEANQKAQQELPLETTTTETPIVVEKPNEVVTETKVEGETHKPTEEKTLFEKLDELNTTPKVEEEKPKEVELSEEIKAKLEKLEKFEKSDISKLLETELSLVDLYQSVKVIDYSKLNVEELIEAEAKLVAGDKFTDELLQEEIAAYESMTSKQKIAYEKELIEKLGKSKVEIGNEIAELLNKKQLEKKEGEQSNKPTAEQLKAEYEKVQKQDLAAITSTLTVLEAEHGLETEISAKIKELYTPEFADMFVDKKTGLINETEFIRTAYKLATYDSVKESAEKTGYEKGYKEAQEKFANPANRPPSANQEATATEKQEMAKLMGWG